jgi:tRNA(Ile)-lysidine synthase TilS/MesJ
MVKMKHILGKMRKAIEDYKMIDEGDKIAVCLSGGKDSITLLNGLKALQRFYPKHFDLIAIAINPGFENFSKNILQQNCDEVGVPLIIEDSHIKEIVFDIRKENNPCSLCANLRRGIINTVAIREGCNKIALGHNMDDVLETFLLNLKYTGNLSTFAPKSYMDKTKITLIRPLILLTEKDTNHFVKKYQKNVMPKVCPMDEHTKREDIKAEIFAWQKEIPAIKANLFGAISRNLDEWKIEQ